MLVIHNQRLLERMRSRYERQDIEQLQQWLEQAETFQFEPLPTGLFSAASVGEETDYTGYSRVWVRDNVLVAHAHWVWGEVAIAQGVMRALLAYFQKHQQRFEAMIHGKADPQDVMQRPHVRFNGLDLTEVDETWAHAQNDALGYFVWLYSQLLLQDLLLPTEDALEMLGLFVAYFEAVQYWQDEDSGHWEEARKISASSIGTVLAGLTTLQQWCDRTNPVSRLGLDRGTLEALIQQGRTALDRILPAECRQPDPAKHRLYDGALLFLIYPLRIVTTAQAAAILQQTQAHLQGEFGIRRYRGDSFWCEDYKQKLDPSKRTIDFSENMAARDALLQGGDEAEWCIFDPIISVIYGLRFQQSQNPQDLEQQIHYLNRSLGQITSQDCKLGALKCPELYYIEQGQHQPSDATPLLWTQANLKLALHWMKQSLS
jgi:phosphorylase kinase alpha/beta subunit